MTRTRLPVELYISIRNSIAVSVARPAQKYAEVTKSLKQSSWQKLHCLERMQYNVRNDDWTERRDPSQFLLSPVLWQCIVNCCYASYPHPFNNVENRDLVFLKAIQNKNADLARWQVAGNFVSQAIREWRNDPQIARPAFLLVSIDTLY